MGMHSRGATSSISEFAGRRSMPTASARHLYILCEPDENQFTPMMTEGKSELVRLRAEVNQLRQEQVSTEYVKKLLGTVTDAKIEPPKWTHKKARGKNQLIPGTIWSDLHWGEVIEPAQVNFINEYNLDIAKSRLKLLTDSTISLCQEYSVHEEYPGIVLLLGGDMVSGNIHEELRETNELPIGPTLLHLAENLVSAIQLLAETFGKVFIYCVPGNHGRLTVLVKHKNYNWESFDWLLYHFLCMLLKDDKRIEFHIPDGPDQPFRMFNHQFMLSHGDKLGARGGDGIIGVAGPIIRGDTKVRAMWADIGAPYETLVIGHYHTYFPNPRIIANGSLIGYGQFAMSGIRVRPEPPQQALWFVHPKHGIVDQRAIFVAGNQRITA